MLSQWINTLYSDPIYKFITIVALVQLTLIVVGIIWLLVPYAVGRHRAAMRNRFTSKLGNSFLYDLENEAKLEEWIKAARRYPVNILYDFINQYFYYYNHQSEIFPKILYVYEKLGLLKRDVDAMSSKIWHRRIIAVRRLMNVASEKEKRAIDRCRTDRHMIKLIALQILGRIGSADDIFENIHDHRIDSRIMEQPFFVLFAGLALEKYRELMQRWTEVQCPRMRRVMLICCARRDGAFAHRFLVEAAASDDLEMRIAFCIAAPEARTADICDLLREKALDPAWEVKAQAARALGMIREEIEGAEGMEQTLAALRSLLTDSMFWVRQSAAFALMLRGQEGRAALEDVHRSSPDKFAQETAQQELERLDMDSPERKKAGGEVAA